MKLNLPCGAVEIEAERRLATARIQLLHIDLRQPYETLLQEEEHYRLDLAVTPFRIKTQGRFMQHWAPERFENAGRLFLVPPGETMQLRSNTGSDRALVLRFPAQALTELADADIKWTANHLETSLDFRSAHIANGMCRIAEEIVRPGFASDVLCETLALEIAVELLRHHATINEHRVRGLPTWRLQIIDERLELDGPAPDLAELASLCGLSVRQLTRVFRASRGTSLGRYIAEASITKAKQRLAAGNTLKQVAYAVGFASPVNFCRAFRKATGMTPGQFKRTQ